MHGPNHFLKPKRFLATIAIAVALNSTPTQAQTPDEDLLLVAALVWHEAGNQCEEGKRLVADVFFQPGDERQISKHNP